jgi:hypothetical protein
LNVFTQNCQIVDWSDISDDDHDNGYHPITLGSRNNVEDTEQPTPADNSGEDSDKKKKKKKKNATKK